MKRLLRIIVLPMVVVVASVGCGLYVRSCNRSISQTQVFIEEPNATAGAADVVTAGVATAGVVVAVSPARAAIHIAANSATIRNFLIITISCSRILVFSNPLNEHFSSAQTLTESNRRAEAR